MMRMNPGQMKRYMKQLGIKTEEWDDVYEVVIKRDSGDVVIRNPSVLLLNAQGQKIFQITGDVALAEEVKKKYSEEDIALVMEQTGASREEVIKALEECDGEVAEAILKILGG